MMARVLKLLYGLYSSLIFVPMVLLTLLLMALGPTVTIRRWIGGRMMRLAMVLCGIRTTVSGREHLPPGSCVFVSNHASLLDGLIWMAWLPARFQFVVKAGAATMPVFGPLMRLAGVVWVDRSQPRKASALLIQLLRSFGADPQRSKSIVMFPEGTIVPEPGLLAFKAGACMLAAKADVPVVPGVLRGTREIFGDGAKTLSHGHIHLEVLPPRQPSSDDRAEVKAMMDDIRNDILARCGEPDASDRVPELLPDSAER